MTARRHATRAGNYGRTGRGPDCPLCGCPIRPSDTTELTAVEGDNGSPRWRSAHKSCRNGKGNR